MKTQLTTMVITIKTLNIVLEVKEDKKILPLMAIKKWTEYHINILVYLTVIFYPRHI